MYTGTLIEDLISTVERAEQQARTTGARELEPWPAVRSQETSREQDLLGVA